MARASHRDFGDLKVCIAWAIQKDREVRGQWRGPHPATSPQEHADSVVAEWNTTADRQELRMTGSTRIVTMLSRRYGKPSPENIETAIKVLYSLTSFEFFDALAGPDRTLEEVAPIVLKLASSFLGIN